MLFIIRGLPGSGKTTLGKVISDEVFSADDFFMVDGEYRFDGTRIREAHESCQSRVREAISACCNGYKISVANTFTKRWEMEPYIKMAKDAGVEYFVIDLFSGGLTDEELFHRNEHSVPLDVIQSMRRRYQHDW